MEERKKIITPGNCDYFRKVLIPSALGDDTGDYAPKNGAYRNAIVEYELNGHTYIYSSDGIPTFVTGEQGPPGPPGHDGAGIEYVDLSGFTWEAGFPEIFPTSYAFGTWSNQSKTYEEILALIESGKRVVLRVTMEWDELAPPLAIAGEYYFDVNAVSELGIVGSGIIIGATQAGDELLTPIDVSFIISESSGDSAAIAMTHAGFAIEWAAAH